MITVTRMSWTWAVLILASTVSCSDKKTGDDDDDIVECSLDANTAALKIGGLFSMSGGPSSAVERVQQEQLDVVVAEVNQGCGTLGTTTLGVGIEGPYRDTHDDPSITADLTQELIDEGAVLLLGAGGGGPTSPSVMKAIEHNIPYGMYFAISPNLTGCTPAQLADPGVTKSASPTTAVGSCWDNKGLVFRTAAISSKWGYMAGEYAKATWPEIIKAATIYQNDSFGTPAATNFRSSFELRGGNSVTAMVPYTTQDNEAAFINHIITATAGDPDLIMGAYRIGDLKTMLNTYAKLRNDSTLWANASATKPANFDNLRFLITGSVRADYGDLSTEALAIMHERAIGLAASWDPETTGFQRWLDAYRAYNPDGQATFQGQMRTYDAAMILLLAMTKANSTEGALISAELRNVANPPGEVIYPGEFAKARRLLLAGTDINYEGGSGAVDIQDNGDAAPIVYEIWSVSDAGAPQTVGPISDDFTAP